MVSDAGAASASILQEGMWLSPHAAEDPSNCNLLWTISLDGPLAARRLAAALDRVVARHAVLRSVFHWQGDRLGVRIMPAGAVALAVVDEPFDATAFAMAPFDLAHGPLYRFALVRRTDQSHELLCGFHHLVIDGVSWPKFAAELAVLLGGGEPPAVEADYFSHVAAQERLLAGRSGEDARSFWRNLLGSLSGPWELPHPATGPGSARASVSVGQFALGEALSARLRQAAAELRTTPFRLAMAGFAALLARIARREEVVLATTVSGRPTEMSRNMIGFFAHTGILRLAIAGAASLRSVLADVQEELEGLLAHEALPMRVAARELAARPDYSRNPLTAVSFTRLPSRLRVDVAGLALRERRVFLPLAERDLAVYFQAVDEGFELSYLGRAPVITHEAAEQLHRQFCLLLEAALAHPDRPVAEFDAMSAEERGRILAWNETAIAYPAMAPLHRLVEAQARRTPQAVAVSDPQRDWTYRELDAAANRIAAALRKRGVAPGNFVMLRMNPSLAMIAAELAVMKCGAAFVPVGTEWPEARLTALAQRIGGAPLILAEHDAPGTFCVLPLLAAGDDPGAPDVHSRLDDPIYCIFTSGSTGLPKGAVNAHRGVVNRLFAMNTAFGDPAEDAVLVTAPVTVDTHVWQFFWALCFGGRVVVAPREVIVTPARLFPLVARAGISVLDFVPSLFTDVVNALRGSGVPGWPRLRLLLVGGEAMRASDAYAFREIVPQCRIVNTYGPTETSIGVIRCDLPLEPVDPVPLGRPFANVQAYVLDGMRLVPFGMPGELCLGGACVGLGYLNDPAETARVFVANPFSSEPGARLYRTGDLARMRADGVIEFLGRIDHQIKIRGVRIEPAEVEAALIRHPAIEAAVVSASATGSLAARILLAGGVTAPGVADLRRHMLEALPVQMVPEQFILCDRFPLLANGKIDRAAVRALAGLPLAGQAIHEAPKGDMEERLAQLWCEVLGRESVGRHDNFFQTLGGDSLQAMRLILRIEENIGVLPSLRQIYEAADLKQLAAELGRGSPHATGARPRSGNIIPLRAQGSRTPLFLIHGWGGFISHFNGIELHIDPLRPVFGIGCDVEEVRCVERPSVEALAAGYAEQILARGDSTIHIAGYSAGGWYAHAVADALLKRGGRIGMFAMLDVRGIALDIDPAVALRVNMLKRLERARIHAEAIAAGGAAEGRLRYAGGVLSRLHRRVWNRTSASPADDAEQSDLFVRLLRTYRPPRLPLHAHVIGPPRGRAVLKAVWQPHAAGGVSFHPLFGEHDDFINPALTPQLSRQLEAIMTALEQGERR
ncbi:non-ribosomal peptide synthetase [Aestuariivirga litoralis]|nr:non-ribosomal peptide synthetase [Aestuariivirga litoralis]